MYKLFKYFDKNAGAYTENVNGFRITFNFTDPDNTDYANFKKEILAGSELQDADGNVMTQEQADDFIKELP